MKKLTFIIVCFMAVCLGANAQTHDAAYEAELDKAVSLSTSKESLTEVFENSFRQFVLAGQMTEANCHAMSEEMADLMYPKIISMTKQVWSKNFTSEELKKVVAWLQSPEGQKMLKLTNETAALQQQLMQDPQFMQQITSVVSKYMGK